MSGERTIELPPEAQATLRSFETLPDWALQAIARGMHDANLVTVSSIQRDHLPGRGPFPVEEHKLGVVTGMLRSEAHSTKPEIEGTTVTSLGLLFMPAIVDRWVGQVRSRGRSTEGV